MTHRPHRRRYTIPLVQVIAGLICWVMFALAVFAYLGSSEGGFDHPEGHHARQDGPSAAPSIPEGPTS